MTPSAIRKAVLEARRFVNLANKVPITKLSNGYECVETGKASGALRRASMDLTRALADLRRAE